MRFADSARAHGSRFKGHVLSVLLALSVDIAGCSKAASPSAPDPSRGPFLGTWTGTITSDVIGTGSATVILDRQIGTSTTPLLSGAWSFAFPDPAFNATGTVSGSLNAGGTLLGLFFSRAIVPCPGEPGDAAQKVVAGIVTVADNHMYGDYIVGGCPGGTMDLVRR